MGEIMQIKIVNAKESLIKKAKPTGNTAHVTVPKRWIGKEVQVVLLEDEN
jgi:putative transposon-encoded protein